LFFRVLKKSFYVIIFIKFISCILDSYKIVHSIQICIGSLNFYDETLVKLLLLFKKIEKFERKWFSCKLYDLIRTLTKMQHASIIYFDKPNLHIICLCISRVEGIRGRHLEHHWRSDRSWASLLSSSKVKCLAKFWLKFTKNHNLLSSLFIHYYNTLSDLRSIFGETFFLSISFSYTFIFIFSLSLTFSHSFSVYGVILRIIIIIKKLE
jgi:hypothetical protein